MIPAVRAMLLGLALVASACGGAPQPESGVITTLCRVAAAPDVATAGSIFHAEAHVPLHELTDELAAVDRATAADLLEAKQVVEADLEADPAPSLPELRSHLDTLLGATRHGLAVLDRPAPDCTTGGS